MSDKPFILTPEAKAALEAERRNLLDVQRPETIEALALARSQGDLSENADYTAARERQTQIESRILQIEAILNNSISAEEAGESKGKGVSIGDTVIIYDLAEKEELKVKVVGSIGGDPMAEIAIVSNESPIGKALLGHEVGDTVLIESIEPYSVEIKAYGRNI